MRGLGVDPIDLPFALLVLLLTTIGVLMVFSASFARSFYEAENPYLDEEKIITCFENTK